MLYNEKKTVKEYSGLSVGDNMNNLNGSDKNNNQILIQL